MRHLIPTTGHHILQQILVPCSHPLVCRHVILGDILFDLLNQFMSLWEMVQCVKKDQINQVILFQFLDNLDIMSTVTNPVNPKLLSDTNWESKVCPFDNIVCRKSFQVLVKKRNMLWC